MTERLFDGADWNFPTLQRIHDACEEIALSELGLDVYPNQIEVITAEHLAPLYYAGPNALFALLTERTMAARGLERADLGCVPVAQRAWAGRSVRMNGSRHPTTTVGAASARNIHFQPARPKSPSSSISPVESGAQLHGRLQRQLDPCARTGVEVRVDEVERDDVAQGRMARVVIGNHRPR